MLILDLFITLLYVSIEFIQLVSSEANEIANKESKKTIAPEHVLKALHVCIILLLHATFCIIGCIVVQCIVHARERGEREREREREDACVWACVRE